MMLNYFYKYQSLENDFIIFDWYKKPNYYLDKDLNDAVWPQIVQRLCNRRIGIGADGILIIKHNQQAGVPEMLIFNADGSSAQSCLNGLRCVVQHLFTLHHYPEKFSVKLGTQIVQCQVSDLHNDRLITTLVGAAHNLGVKTVETPVGIFMGYVVDVGNPHFIIFQSMQHDWIAQNGHFIEQHTQFIHGTNVEFVWPDGGDSHTFYMHVYERGCGVTRACSSGAAALAGLLVQREMVSVDQSIDICMPGGTVRVLVNQYGEISLQATAHCVFEGTLPLSMLEVAPERPRGDEALFR